MYISSNAINGCVSYIASSISKAVYYTGVTPTQVSNITKTTTGTQVSVDFNITPSSDDVVTKIELQNASSVVIFTENVNIKRNYPGEVINHRISFSVGEEEGDFPQTQVLYCTCNTNSSNSEKIVSNANFTLYIGVAIFVKFAKGNTSSTVTLNVNSTGGIPMRAGGTTIIANTYQWKDGDGVVFTYDGQYWNMLTA